MLASRHPAGARVLQVSAIRALSHAPVVSSVIVSTAGVGRLPRQRASSPVVSRRSFWWARNRRHRATLLGGQNYHKNCKTRYEVTKDKSIRPPYKSTIWNWRLSSSWGKPGGRWVKSDPTTEDENKANEQYSEWRQAYLVWRANLFKTQLEKDPYGMLFGKAAERSINPWTSLDWLTRSKVEKEGASSEATFTKSPPQDGDDAKTTTNPVGSNKTTGQSYTKDQQVGDTARTQKAMDRHVLDSTEPRPSVNTTNNPVMVEDYEIDPITLRKVHKIHGEPRPSGAETSFDAAVNIPVKTFEGGMRKSFLLDRQKDKSSTAEEIPIKPSNEIRPSTSPNVDSKRSPAHTSGSTWLAQEGFGERPAVITDKPAPQTSDSLKTETSGPAKASTTRLENSLDRYLRKADDGAKPHNRGKASGKPLEYRAEENKAEDIDLLRASDVRASYRHVAKPEKETDPEKEERRRKIEAKYQEHRQNLETRYTEELAAVEARETSAIAERPDAESGQRNTPQDLGASFLNEISIQEPSVVGADPGPSLSLVQSPNKSYPHEIDARVQKEENSYIRKLEAASAQTPPGKNDFMGSMKAQLLESGIKYTKEMKRGIDYAHDALLRIENNLSSSIARDKKQEAAEQALVEEVKSQKLAMEAIEDRKTPDTSKTASSAQRLHRGEGDMSANVHEFGERRRWYKNQAPHAVRDQAQKLRDGELVREIRGIYEDSYGTIDTRHRQAPDSSTGEKPQVAIAQVRKQSKEESVPDYSSLNFARNPQEGASKPTSANHAVAAAGKKAQEEMEVPSNLPSSSADKSRRGLSTTQTGYKSKEEVVKSASSQSWQDSDRKGVKLTKRQLRESKRQLRQSKRQLRESNRQSSLPSLFKLWNAKLGAIKRETEKAVKLWSIFSHSRVRREQRKETVLTSTGPSPASSAAPATLHRPSSPTPPTFYKILAHEPLTGKVSIASTTSAASPTEAPLSVSEVLSRLSSPARFLPHFSPLRHAGYEIVSGSGDVLVFKKVRDARSSAVHGEEAAVEDSVPPGVAAGSTQVDPVRASTPASSSSLPPISYDFGKITPPRAIPIPSLHAKPTPRPLPSKEPPSNSAPTVRRQEAVFSGSPRWRPKNKHNDGRSNGKGFQGKVRRAAKRVFWVGVWTAGCCYAVGVVAEYFRTGGVGGLGPQGF